MRRTLIHQVAGLVVIILPVFAPVHVVVAQIYLIEELVPPVETPSCRAHGVNDLGNVVGYCQQHPTTVDPNLAVIWENGTGRLLGNLPGYPDAVPLALNNLDEVVGYASSNTATRAVLWTGGAIVDLNDRLAPDSGWELLYANDINDQGTVVGWGYHDSVARAYSLNGSSITDLGTLGGNTSFATAINNVDAVVGGAEDGLGQTRACLWRDGQITNLGVNAGTYSDAWGVNDDNVVVGRFGESDPESGMWSSPFVWASGQATELNSDGAFLTHASAVNNAGQIVGTGAKATPSFWYNVAILWQNGLYSELYDLITPQAGWLIGLGSAQDINDFGQIVGDSWKTTGDSYEHAYLLTPLVANSRFVSFLPGNPGLGMAIRVRLVSLHHVDPPYTGGASVPFTSFEGQVRWVGSPIQYVESSSSGIPFYAAQLQCAPYYQDWSTVGLLHVTGSAVTPSSIYEVENLAASCAGIEASCTAVSAPLEIVTTRWGDVRSPYNPPDGSVQPDISDVSALVDKFRNVPAAPIKARGILAGAPGNPFGEVTHDVLNVDFGFSHISSCVDAFRGVPYPYVISSCP